MTAELVLSALYESDDTGGDVTAIAVTDQRIIAVGRAADRSPLVLVSSDARHFEPRTAPRDALCDVLAVGDSLWACGERGLLAVSRDGGERWQTLDTGTTGCLHALALGNDGAIWVAGEAGYAARVMGDAPRRIDIGATARLHGARTVHDELVLLGDGGTLVRWRDGKAVTVACNTGSRLTALAVTAKGTWVVVGEGGFIARSPDGTWYSRVDARVEADLEAIAALPDGSLAIVGDRGHVLVSTDDARTWRGAAHTLGPGAAGAHLWTIRRFGGGALIGGGGGRILRLAPPDDATWTERTNIFIDPRAIDDVFAAGPEGFIANGLAVYLEVIGRGTTAHGEPASAASRGGTVEGRKLGDVRERGEHGDIDERGDKRGDIGQHQQSARGPRGNGGNGGHDGGNGHDSNGGGSRRSNGGAARRHAGSDGHGGSGGHGGNGNGGNGNGGNGNGNGNGGYGGNGNGGYGGNDNGGNGNGNGGYGGNGNGGNGNGGGNDDAGHGDEPEDIAAFEYDMADHGIHDAEALALLGEPGDADAFRQNYGAPLPLEVKRLLELAGGCAPSTFTELRLDTDLRPDVGSHNLFELMIRRNQQAYLGSDLVEAFCGVFEIASQNNGDTYHLEIHPWDTQRQVLHYDHENAAFSGVCADSLDSLVYLAALLKAGETGAISDEICAAGLAALDGKVAPTWQFAIDEKAPELVVLEPRRRDTEFFFYRSRWICALLRNDDLTELSDVPSLFDPALNQVIPADQLQARFEACDRFIPTALYAMWRSYLFDEPELARYLEIGRQHAARLVRDAARLIDELRAGRNELGTIHDVRAWLDAFRALDLDPRRADQRKAETDRRAEADAAHRARRDAELARTPPERWPQLAWQWLDDGVAHRALLARLDRTQRAQIAAIDELRDASEDERAIALPRVAVELSPELEAILVGSLVRSDDLEGVLVKPTAVLDERIGRPGDERDRGRGGDDDDADADRLSGWDAIDRALAPIYGDTEPLHYGTVRPYGFGGDDPISGISVFARVDPAPHWHFVTYGFTELFRKESDDPEESGYGFELTLRLARATEEAQPPTWALNFLQNLARYVFSTGNAFASGHKMGLNGPIALDHDTQITAVCFADDPELGDIESQFGKARFVQIVGITDDEYRVIQEWSTGGLIDILGQRIPFLLTDLARRSVLDDPATAALVRERIDREGSSEDLTFAGEMVFSAEHGQLRIELGALYAATLPRAMRGRTRHRREYELRGRDAALRIVPREVPGYRIEGRDLVLEVSQELAAEIEAALRDNLAGTYHFAAWPALTIVVTPSIIRGQDGSATDVRGVVDLAEARRLLDEDHARRAAAATHGATPEASVDDDDEGDDKRDGEGDGARALDDVDAPSDGTANETLDAALGEPEGPAADQPRRGNRTGGDPREVRAEDDDSDRANNGSDDDRGDDNDDGDGDDGDGERERVGHDRDEVRARSRDLTTYAGELLAARARMGALDPRAAAALRPVLDVAHKHENRRIAVASVLGALRDRESVPALIRILEVTRIASALDAVGKEELLAATAAALGAIGDPAAIPALSKLIGAPGRYNDEPRAAAAAALVACVDAAGARAAIGDGVLEAIARSIDQADDDEYAAEMHLAYGALARTLPAERRAAARQRLLELELELDPGGVAMLARRAALVIASGEAPAGDTAAALRARVHAALRDPGYDHDAAIRTLRIVLAIAARVPGLVDAADLVWLTRLAEPDIRARAHALLDAAGHPMPPAPAFDRRTARRLSDGELVRRIGEPHVVGRPALVVEAGRRKLGAARAAIVRAAHAAIDRARPGGQDLLDPDARLLETSVAALLDGPLDDATIAMFDRMLRHANPHVKWELLQAPPRDKRLIGGMIHVLGEAWGWQETAARNWLASYKEVAAAGDQTGDETGDDTGDNDETGDDDGHIN